MQLVILAAGMGSRFGGLKQLEPVHDNGEFILDYSIYDAIRNGFDKVVFIIKEENYDIFRETIGMRIEDKIEVEYVFQNNDNLPSNAYIPEGRVKPLGTGHAILCCKDVVKDNFMIINADDFYGNDAYKVASEFKSNNENEFALVGYKVKNTVSDNGSVKRGICKIDGGYLTEIVESSISNEEGKYIAKPLNGEESFEVDGEDLVSMNMIIFTPKIFDYLEEKFIEFFDKNKDDMERCEYLIPEVIRQLIKENKVKVKMLNTNAIWKGITYKEDKDDVVNSINEMIDNGEYPERLWKYYSELEYMEEHLDEYKSYKDISELEKDLLSDDEWQIFIVWFFLYFLIFYAILYLATRSGQNPLFKFERRILWKVKLKML